MLLLLVAVVVLGAGFVTILPAPRDCSAPHGALRVLWCTSVSGGSPQLAFAFPEWRAKSGDGMDPAVQELVSCWKVWPQAAGGLEETQCPQRGSFNSELAISWVGFLLGCEGLWRSSKPGMFVSKIKQSKSRRGVSHSHGKVKQFWSSVANPKHCKLFWTAFSFWVSLLLFFFLLLRFALDIWLKIRAKDRK